MTEKELELLGFEKQVVLDEESGNGYDFYFYLKNTVGLVFSSCANDELEDNEWSVHIVDTNTKWKEFGEVQALFNLLEKHKLEDEEYIRKTLRADIKRLSN